MLNFLFLWSFVIEKGLYNILKWKMQHAICFLAHVPMREMPRHSDQMVSELLFGELYLCLEQEKNNWFLIKNDFDDYKGWINVTSKAFGYLTEKQYINLKTTQVFSTTYLTHLEDKNNLSHWLSIGSVLNLGSDIFKKYKFKCRTGPFQNFPQNKYLYLEKLAYSYLNVPYLWGGRSVFGIDCSGFIQQVFKQIGIFLPRDAYQQADVLDDIHIKNAQLGDLLFFKSDYGRIGHVGLVLDKKRIIHASGQVRIDNWNEIGILRDGQNQYSHRLACVKRVK